MTDNSHTKSSMFQRDRMNYIYLFEYIHTCPNTHMHMYTCRRVANPVFPADLVGTGPSDTAAGATWMHTL